MRKLLLIIIIVLFTIGCEEDFDPKGEFRQEYVLSSIIRVDTSYQICTLSKSYDVDGYDPYENTTDPTIDEAFVRLWYKDTVFIMRDTVVERTDLSRYSDSIRYFYLDNFQPELNQELEIEALLTNGKRLRAFTTLPNQFIFTAGSDVSIPSTEDEDFISIKWETGSNRMIYNNRLYIYYYENNNKTEVKRKAVPISFINTEEGEVPYFPIPTRDKAAVYSRSEFDRALKEISEGVESKEQFTIINAYVDILLYDENLSGYYLSTLEGTDGFSVRLDASDFSNVIGGFGVFGSYFRTGKYMHIDEDYIRSFGYKPL